MNDLQRIYHDDVIVSLEELQHRLQVVLQEGIEGSGERVNAQVILGRIFRDVEAKLNKFDVLMIHNCQAEYHNPGF